MAEIKMLPLDKIMLPERLRDVQEDHAFMIGQSIARIGLLNPITVRATPRGQRPYTLVAGAHRLHGSGLAGLKEIATIVVKADQTEAQMVEIEENVFRNDLSKLDRAVCVLRYRELWEEKHGWNKGGRPAEETSVNFTGVSEESAQGQFFLRVAERMGLSRNAIEKAQQIGRNIVPELRALLRKTDAADNQSLLLQIARMAPERQQQIVMLMTSQAAELDAAIAATDPEQAVQKPTAEGKALATLAGSWSRLSFDVKWQALEQIGVADILTAEQRAILAERFTGKRKRGA